MLAMHLSICSISVPSIRSVHHCTAMLHSNVFSNFLLSDLVLVCCTVDLVVLRRPQNLALHG